MQGVLEGFAEEQEVGGAEAVVRVAGEDGLAVEVGAADGGIEVKGYDIPGIGDGASHKQADTDRAFKILR